MKKYLFILSAILLVPFSCKSQEKKNIIIDRINFVYNLKPYITNNIWGKFDEKAFDVPLVYYTETKCFVVNPIDNFFDTHDSKLIFENNDVKIYETDLLDSISFHMAVDIILGDSTSDYNYRSPYMNCSSVEITKKVIPSMSSTEEWATMIMHEYFHGFQFKHPNFLDYFEQNISSTSQNTLKQIYKDNDWFKKCVDEENRILLLALAATDSTEISRLIKSFFILRENRRDKTVQTLGVDIVKTEAVYETMEGTARYIEYSLYDMLAKESPDTRLMQTDTSYYSNSFFKGFKLEAEKWLYETDKTTYFYATGFNIARLLDMLSIEYKSRLFNTGNITLEQILKERYMTYSRVILRTMADRTNI